MMALISRSPSPRHGLAARRLLLEVLPLLLAGAVILLASDPALARVGGGSSYSGGSSSWGGGSSYSGGGSADGLISLLIWLLMSNPVIGIPVLIIVVVVALIKKSRSSGSQVYRTHQPQAYRPPPAFRPEVVRRVDANFSEPAFLDFAQLLYARVHQERAAGNLSVLSAYLSSQVSSELQERSEGVDRIHDVIFGATRIEAFRITGGFLELSVFFETNMTEQRSGSSTQILLEERWRFRKRQGALSPAPKDLLAMSCPGCGNPVETRPNGTCVHCDSPVGAGQMLWQVSHISVSSSSPVKPPPLSLGSGAERGTDFPTVFDPAYGAQLRAFRSRHPEFSMQKFKDRVTETFMALQSAWTTQRWQDARPYETDHLYQTHRYWMERYSRFKLRNILEQVRVIDVVPVKITSDAFYEALTVRIKASMIDYTLDSRGKVVGGDKNRPRTFTEYWTFIRSAGQSTAPRQKANTCPSCGAPLDNVSQTGICGYCDAKITGGDFDWVLSSIEQDESYRG